jgi:glucokinase
MSQRFIAVDVGGTQIRAALCNAEGEILRRATDLTEPRDGADAVMDRIENAIRRVWPQGEQITAIGLASPGPLDPWSGVVLEAPNIPCWDNYPLRDIIHRRLGVPALVGNDANLAALAEHRFGAGRGSANLIYITISTGVGGGIIVDDRLLLGEHGLAGEIGHIKVRPDGPLCGCGHPGCLEAQTSGPSIAREARRRIRAGEHSLALELAGGDLQAISAKTLNRAAQKGDTLAAQVFHQAGTYLGLGLVTLLHLFDPDTIVVGGGVSKAGDLLLAPAQELIRQQAMTERYWRDTSIVPAALGDDVGLLGALALVLSDPSIAPV